MGDRKAEERQAADSGADAGHDLPRVAARSEKLQLLAAASEDARVAALEADNGGVSFGRAGQQLVDALPPVGDAKAAARADGYKHAPGRRNAPGFRG